MRILYQSPQLTIREFSPREEQLFSNFFENKAIARYIPERSPEEYHILFRNALIDYQNGPFGWWGIFDANQQSLIGNCLLRKFAEIPAHLEIGYSLHPDYWGKGLATEVALALTRYGFTHTSTDQIVALTTLDNIGSQKVLKKAGFKKLENLTRADLVLAHYSVTRTPPSTEFEKNIHQPM